MLSESFERLYLLLRARYYRRIAKEVGTGKGVLTAAECFALEVLLLMDAPTVSDFAAFIGMSLPAVHYRINSLVEKGYLEKRPSQTDRRETYLMVTQKYRDFYGMGNPEIRRVIEDVENAFSQEEVQTLTHMIDRVTAIINAPTAQDTGDAS